MKSIVVAFDYPGVSGGEAITKLALLQQLKIMGHEVEFVNIKYSPKNKINRKNRQFLEDQKIKVTEYGIKNYFTNFIIRNKNLTEKIKKKIFKEKIDYVFFYGVKCCAAIFLDKLNFKKKFIMLGDPWSQVHLTSLKFKILNLKENLTFKEFLKTMPLIPKQLFVVIYYYFFVERRINLFLGGFATAYHHAQYYKSINKKIVYHPSPVLDPPKGFDIKKILHFKKNKIKNFIIIGHNLSGTSNSYGMKNLNENLKKIDEEYNNYDWKIYIVGNNSEKYKNIFSKYLQKKRLKFIGYKDISKIHTNVHVLLNTIDNKLGNRTRIAQCFAYGIPCLSHVAALNGSPELSKKKSGALFFENSVTLLKKIKKFIDNKFFYYKISNYAYTSFKKNYSKERLSKWIASLENYNNVK